MRRPASLPKLKASLLKSASNVFSYRLSACVFISACLFCKVSKTPAVLAFLPTGTFASVSPIICISIFASLLGSVSTSASACHLGQCVTKSIRASAFLSESKVTCVSTLTYSSFSANLSSSALVFTSANVLPVVKSFTKILF